MQIHLTKLEPAPVMVAVDNLPKQGWRRPRRLSLRSDQIALVAEAREVRFHASDGEHSIDLDISPEGQALLADRELDVFLELTECQFLNGTGRLTLWAPVRFLSLAAGPASHPVVRNLGGALDCRTFRDSLERCLARGLGSLLCEALGQVSYEADARRLVSIAEALSRFDRGQDVRRALLDCAGLELADALQVMEARCPDRDQEYERQDAARKWREEQRLAMEKTLTDMNLAEAVKRAGSRVRIQEILDDAESKKAELIRQRIVLDGQLEEHRTQASMAAMDLELAARRKDVEKTEQEVELIRARVESERQSQDAVNRLLTRQQALQEQIEQFARVIETLSSKVDSYHQVEEPLALVATWRAYRRTQNGDSLPVLFRPVIPSGARLPSGTWLDVSVTVSRDAYVYILVKSANGCWQRLIPDADGLMGLTRSHRQPANQQTVWPGENRNPVVPGHQSIPYWKLDDVTGWEHVLVAASVTEVDVAELLNQDQTLGALRSRGVPLLTRGFTSGGSARRSDAPTATGPETREMRNCLVGDGCVVDEIVIEHY